MKIGILGSGNMGRALGLRWAQAGHEVFFGGRDAGRASEVAQFVGRGSRGGTLDEAARFGDVLLHTARDAMPSAMVTSLEALDGKILVDLNNGSIPEGFAYDPVNLSFTERFQADAPSLRVVKAFNLFAMEFFEHDAATLEEHGVSAFIAGDDDEAKAVVGELAKVLGLTPVDAGGARNARLLEGMADFIRYLMIAGGMGPFTALSALRLPPASGAHDLGGRAPSNFK